jgi:hypothetical protein
MQKIQKNSLKSPKIQNQNLLYFESFGVLSSSHKKFQKNSMNAHLIPKFRKLKKKKKSTDAHLF